MKKSLAAWQPLFDNAKKIRTLLAGLQELTLAIIDPGPAGKPGYPPQTMCAYTA